LKTTKAVHENGGKIIIQLMHSGRISHPLNMPVESQILAPSQVKAAGQMWTDLLTSSVPKEMTEQDIYMQKLNMWLQLKMPYLQDLMVSNCMVPTGIC
jgi:N-ethylmaleimide reductase